MDIGIVRMTRPQASTQVIRAFVDLWEAVMERLKSVLGRFPEGDRTAVLDRVACLIEEEAARERQRCVAACRARADLWRTTLAAKSKLAAAQDEARARANEAEYLADLLEVAGAGVAPSKG